MAQFNFTGTQKATPWLPYFKANAEARLRLFCFSYAGGNALIYRDWAASLPANIQVCPVELPGHGNRLKETRYTNLLSLVKAMAQGLLPYLDKPFAFFGHSLGATVSFELARELRRHSLEPIHLFVSARLAPQLPNREEIIHNLPEEQFIDELLRLNGMEKQVFEDPELRQMIIPLLRADFELGETYTHTPEPPLRCPITVFGGLRDFDVTREDLEGWREQTTSAFSVRILPGDHFFVNTASASILRVITQELYPRIPRT